LPVKLFSDTVTDRPQLFIITADPYFALLAVKLENDISVLETTPFIDIAPP
jgi:hypothetical protein